MAAISDLVDYSGVLTATFKWDMDIEEAETWFNAISITGLLLGDRVKILADAWFASGAANGLSGYVVLYYTLVVEDRVEF